MIDRYNLPSNPANTAEEVAMKSLQQLLGGQVQRLDRPGGPSGLHDFDLTCKSGKRIAVEVTACVDKTTAEFVAALDKQAVHLDVTGMRRSWDVRLNERVRLTVLIGEVAPCLATLERHDVSGMAQPWKYNDQIMLRSESTFSESATEAHVAAQALINLGVDTAWAFDRLDGQQSVEFVRRSGNASGNSETLVTAEVDRAAETKRAVLSRPSAMSRDGRHLFVWLDSDYCGQTHFALWSGHPASAPPPTLPSSMDHTWVAGWSSTPGEGIGFVVIWEAERGTGWHYPAALPGPTVV